MIDEYWVSFHKGCAHHYGWFKERISEEYFLLGFYSLKNRFKVVHISNLTELDIYNDFEQLAKVHKSITPKEWHE